VHHLHRLAHARPVGRRETHAETGRPPRVAGRGCDAPWLTTAAATSAAPGSCPGPPNPTPPPSTTGGRPPAPPPPGHAPTPPGPTSTPTTAGATPPPARPAHRTRDRSKGRSDVRRQDRKRAAQGKSTGVQG